MAALAPAAIKAALSDGTKLERESSTPDEVDPVSAAGRRLAERRGWSPEDLDDLMMLIEAGREE